MPESLPSLKQIMRERILTDGRLYGSLLEEPRAFIPGETPIPASGKVIGGQEVVNGLDAVLDGWLTEGHWVDQFERAVAKYLGRRVGAMTNSGSSANLLAMSAITSQSLGEKRARRGDFVITAAAGFPTTINPIIQAGLKPLFIDVDLETLVPSVGHILAAMRPGVRGIILAHTLGNPWPVEKWGALGGDPLWVIEDNCDALGSSIEIVNVDGDITTGRTGGFADLATQSFYPAHHITTGEGGMVLTDRPALHKVVESIRDWGRDCWCDPGDENTCGRRFDWQLGLLPGGYDHKYIYSELGYNLKATDMQAAIGVAQILRFEEHEYIQRRRANWAYLDSAMRGIPRAEEFFYFHRARSGTIPSWFGYPLTVKPEAPFTRHELMRYLADFKIGARVLFAGNYLWQPVAMAMGALLEKSEAMPLDNTDLLAKGGFWLGIWPGLNEEMLAYVVEVLNSYIKLH